VATVGIENVVVVDLRQPLMVDPPGHGSTGDIERPESS
jgi:hypothetical protein